MKTITLISLLVIEVYLCKKLSCSQEDIGKIIGKCDKNNEREGNKFIMICSNILLEIIVNRMDNFLYQVKFYPKIVNYFVNREISSTMI